jgi:hypothetical protein
MIVDFLSRCVDLFSTLGVASSLPILPLIEGSPACLPAGGWRRLLSLFYLGGYLLSPYPMM